MGEKEKTSEQMTGMISSGLEPAKLLVESNVIEMSDVVAFGTFCVNGKGDIADLVGKLPDVSKKLQNMLQNKDIPEKQKAILKITHFFAENVFDEETLRNLMNEHRQNLEKADTEYPDSTASSVKQGSDSA